jgi:nicotinamide mononucleotide (NMN) deamidase PncC
VNAKIATEIAEIMIERELTLGTVECGENGIVSHAIFDAPDGPAVLGDSLIVEDFETAIDLLDLPRPQLTKAGDFSAKAARAAAREGRLVLGVSYCLAVWMRPPNDAPETDPRPVYIALHTGEQAFDQTLQVGGSEKERQRLVNRALTMIREALG